MIHLLDMHPDVGDGVTGFDEAAELALLVEKALRLEEVAETLDLSLRQVQAHIDDGSLIAVNVGRGQKRRDLRVVPEDLEGFLRRRRTGVVKTVPKVRESAQRPWESAQGPREGAMGSYSQRRLDRIAAKPPA